MTDRTLAIIESPFAGNLAENAAYTLEAMRDSLARGEAPFASHVVYPQILDDSIALERSLGMDLAWGWIEAAVKGSGTGRIVSAVYVDRGISPGMAIGIERAAELGIRISVRRIIT